MLGFLALPTSVTTRWHQLDGYTFDVYKAEFGKAYAGEEHNTRKSLFDVRLSTIRGHNTDPVQTYKRGVNHFTDHSEEELLRMHGLDRSLHFSQQEGPRKVDSLVEETAYPPSLSWRERGALTPVKNQGACGSCWTFASTETLESRWFLKTGNMQELSEQFILDCTPNPHQCGGQGGCMGGTAELAYERLSVLGGIPSEWTYPYISGAGANGTCHGLPLKPEHPHGIGNMAANVSGLFSTLTNSYASMMSALLTGPLAISVDAGAWHDYEEGVFDGGNATNPALDHLVQLVGYGTTSDGQDYFEIRNSWTPMWGEHGFIRLKRSASPTCGLDVNPADGNGCKGGPPTVKVCGQNGMLYDGVYPLL